MSAPRPSEADVEAVVEVIVSHQRIPTYRGNSQRCVGCDHLRDETDGANSPRHARHVAEQILASDWLAARDAEHEREVAALRERKETYHEQWMLTERDLGDVRGEIKALADGWHAVAGEDRDIESRTLRIVAATLHHALLPRDDAAGAGGGA